MNNATPAAMMEYMDSVIATMQEAGFSNELTHHGMHALGSRPHIAGMLDEIHHDDDEEFVFGLDSILDGLERLHAAAG